MADVKCHFSPFSLPPLNDWENLVRQPHKSEKSYKIDRSEKSDIGGHHFSLLTPHSLPGYTINAEMKMGSYVFGGGGVTFWMPNVTPPHLDASTFAYKNLEYAK